MAKIRAPKGTNTTKSKGAPKWNSALGDKVFGMSPAKKANNAKIAVSMADNARVSKIHAAGAAATKRAQKAAKGGGGGQRRDRKGRWT